MTRKVRELQRTFLCVFFKPDIARSSFDWAIIKLRNSITKLLSSNVKNANYAENGWSATSRRFDEKLKSKEKLFTFFLLRSPLILCRRGYPQGKRNADENQNQFSKLAKEHFQKAPLLPPTFDFHLMYGGRIVFNWISKTHHERERVKVQPKEHEAERKNSFLKIIFRPFSFRERVSFNLTSTGERRKWIEKVSTVCASHPLVARGLCAQKIYTIYDRNQGQWI